MTATARNVLADCRSAAAELVNGVQGDAWRRNWVLSVVLLRTVGHVLANVDSARDENLRRSIDDWWKQLRATKPEPVIFWKFIEADRNLILKEYLINAEYGIRLSIPLLHLFPGQKDEERPPPVSTEYRYEVASGPYKGQDQRTILQEAITWWEIQLSAIEGAAREA
jgi:hypothetical protein